MTRKERLKLIKHNEKLLQKTRLELNQNNLKEKDLIKKIECLHYAKIAENKRLSGLKEYGFTYCGGVYRFRVGDIAVSISPSERIFRIHEVGDYYVAVPTVLFDLYADGWFK